MCTRIDLFHELRNYKEEINLAGRHTMKAEGIGNIKMNINGNKFVLLNVLYVPGLQCNFISIGKALSNGCSVIFNEEYVLIKDKNKVLIKANCVNNLFLCNMGESQFLAFSKAENELITWHKRYGHLNIQSLHELKNTQLVNGLNFVSKAQQINCLTCMKCKCSVKPFGKSFNRSSALLELVHTDVCGPINKPSIGGSRYFVTMIDDKSRYVHVYFAKNKSDVLNIFKNYVRMAERQTGNKLKTIRSDNGTEYINKEFDDYLKENGITRQLTVPYTPQQNGVAERFNRTLVEMARTMLVSAGMDECFWAEAINCAAYLRNRCPTSALAASTPFEMWTGRKPSVKHLRIFGSTAVALNKTQNKKFCSKGAECILVGYSESSKAYRLYDKMKRDVIISRDVCIIENNEPEYVNVEDDLIKNIVTEEAELNSSEKEDSNESDESDVENSEDEEMTRRGPGRPRILRNGERGRPKKQYNILSLMQGQNVMVPSTAAEALSSNQALEWQNAMQEEYEALLKNNTWQVVTKQKGKKPIACKWVFSLKRNASGEINRFKARLVAKGCSQMYGVDYNETFSPVVRYSTIRILLALAAEHNLYVHQLDVSSAYLNAELEEEVLMYPPEMFEEEPDKVLKLNKALYGLKQSGRVWNQKLHSVLEKIGFKACTSEPCMYTMTEDEKTCLMAVYVDDLLLACSSLSKINEIKQKLSSEFQIVDKGTVDHFLGIEVSRENETGAVTIGQKQHIMRMLKEFNINECRTTTTPLEVNFQVKCNNNSCKRADKSLYQSMIGSLMYIAISTRPDILHSTCKLSQVNSDPHSEHLEAAKHVMRYLYTTADLKIKYEKTGTTIKGYTDADWAGDALDRKSFSGLAFFLGGAAVHWESKKQRSVALSSTEAEYMALSAGTKEAIFLTKLLNEMRIGSEIRTVDIHVDNLSAINLAKNPVYHARSKHIDVRYHHVRDCLKNGCIKLVYCPSKEMAADILTKNLAKVNHKHGTHLLGLK